MSEPSAAKIPLPPPPFLDVPMLLQASQPRARRGFLAPALVALAVLILGSAYLSSRSPQMKQVVDFFSAAMMVLIAIGMMSLMYFTVRRHREERARVEAVEELVQLRRWPQAAIMLQTSLLVPSLTIENRSQLLLFLSTVLARYNRFDDAIAVQSHLLETIDPDPATAHALHLGRAMAMLREDHLVDADCAITELRREVNRAVSAMKAQQEESEEPKEPAEPVMSAGLALIEMYRDVKTGHNSEALEMFNRALPAFRKQLGGRVGDAHALAAKAFDALKDETHARLNWERATLLSPVIELTRRYPELLGISQRYSAVERPADAQRESA